MNLIGLLSLLVFFKILLTLLLLLLYNIPHIPNAINTGEYLRLLLAHLPNNIYSTDLKEKLLYVSV